jgi:hypothetical protein
MAKNNVSYGFLFIDDRTVQQELYFVGFQKGQTPSNADQVIIVDTSDSLWQNKKVAYAVDPIKSEDNEAHVFERLCRVAVAQFLAKFAMDNFLARVLSLELTRTPWQGPVIPI